MKVRKINQRLRVVRDGVAKLAAIYRRDRNLGRLVGRLWFVTTREGLGGLKSRIVVPLGSVVDKPVQLQSTPVRRLLYDQWLSRFDILTESNLQGASRHLSTLALPDILIMAVVTRDSLSLFTRTAASWQDSIHPGWQAAVLGASDLSPSDLVTLRLLVAANPQITMLVTTSEVEEIKDRFDYTLFCFGPMQLNSLSTYMFLEAAIRTDAEIVYSDNDQLDGAGNRTNPAFKPQFSPEYISNFNYIGNCLLISRSVKFTPEQASMLFRITLAEYDRLVAAIVAGRRVEHLPFILFHVFGKQFRIAHAFPTFVNNGPGVAIIIPTRNGFNYLKSCIDSILEKTSYNLAIVDIIIVDNNSTDPEVLKYLDDLAQSTQITLLRYSHQFNFAEINNFGARATNKDILVFLNNDTIVFDGDWLSKLVWYAKRLDVGVVGAKLLFPDGTIQHGGCAAGASMGTVQHLLTNCNPADVAVFDHTREMSLMTGACLAVRRTVFYQIGGFDPILKITWNDVKFCLECLSAGLRNIYIADPLLIHDESKTRGGDDTKEKIDRYFSEANYTRRHFCDYFYDDPSYSPNLSLENAGQLAEPPRVLRPWSNTADRPKRILLLSAVYKIGFGVPLVIQQQAMHLKRCGYDVIIGGPKSENDFSFPNCERVVLGSAKEAAIYAFEADVSLIVSHTPPYFEIPILIGAHIPVLAYDYGEPSADFFPEPTRSYLVNVEYQKRAAAALTTSIATISQSVKDETLNKDAIVAGLANSHLPAWSEACRPERDRVRHELGWTDRFVILTVCRFGENERAYKGLDKIASIMHEFPFQYPKQSKSLIWAIAGAGSSKDVEQVEQLGFTVFPNVTDKTLIELYMAADGYMGFSRWEGYNLGISQALAMALPTIASDIPAHREFPIVTSNSTLAVCGWLADEVEARRATRHDRQSIIYEWESSTAGFIQIVKGILRRPSPQRPKFGPPPEA